MIAFVAVSLSADIVKAVLARLSPAGAAAVGAGLIAASVLAVVATESWLLGTLLTPVCAIGVVLVLMAGFRGASSTFGQRASTLGAWSLATVVAVSVLAAALSRHYNKATNVACNDAIGWSYRARDSLELRRAALAYADQRMASWKSFAPRLLGELSSTCDDARRDLERQGRGLCPQHPIEGAPCRCGTRSWPEDTGCRQKPSCLYDNHGDMRGEPERFNCWRDRL